MTVEALREFILGQGFSMSSNTMEWDKFWTINKRIIDPIAPRYTGITAENQALLVLSNFGDDSVPQVVSVDLHPKNPQVGTKVISRSPRVLLEQDDARLIKEGEEVSSRARLSLFLSIFRPLYHSGSFPKLLRSISMMKPRLWFSDF